MISCENVDMIKHLGDTMFNFNDIKIICLDLDGVLTDGMYLVSASGEVSKSFYTRDFFSCQQAQKNGLCVVILTHASDEVIDRKIETLPKSCKSNLFLLKQDGDKSKIGCLASFLGGLDWGAEVTFDNVAYMGDADNDRDIMDKCGWIGCPSDAVPIIKESVNFCSVHPGGHGAVYEFIMDILNKRIQHNV